LLDTQPYAPPVRRLERERLESQHVDTAAQGIGFRGMSLAKAEHQDSPLEVEKKGWNAFSLSQEDAPTPTIRLNGWFRAPLPPVPLAGAGSMRSAV
jgi:hypothetical protein